LLPRQKRGGRVLGCLQEAVPLFYQSTSSCIPGVATLAGWKKQIGEVQRGFSAQCAVALAVARCIYMQCMQTSP
jgi:hypothetical protein